MNWTGIAAAFIYEITHENSLPLFGRFQVPLCGLLGMIKVPLSSYLHWLCYLRYTYTNPYLEITPWLGSYISGPFPLLRAYKVPSFKATACSVAWLRPVLYFTVVNGLMWPLHLSQNGLLGLKARDMVAVVTLCTVQLNEIDVKLKLSFQGRRRYFFGLRA
jgi:hypothetical protein